MAQGLLFPEETTVKISLAICPDERTINEIRKMKDLLYENIGFYKSRNAQAHITILPELLVNKEHFENKLRVFCSSQYEFQICLDHFGSFTGGTFYLGLSEDSTILFNNFVRNFSLFFKEIKLNHKAPPHISIARTGLTNKQLFIASQLFKKVDIQFNCNNISIRRFNEYKKQYEVSANMEFKKSH